MVCAVHENCSRREVSWNVLIGNLNFVIVAYERLECKLSIGCKHANAGLCIVFIAEGCTLYCVDVITVLCNTSS
jgi:hypothetical protein